MKTKRPKVRCVPFAELTKLQGEVDREVDAVNWLLRHMAENLPEAAPTAKAVQRAAPWEEILQIARWDGNLEIAALLEDALKTLFSDGSFRRERRSMPSR